MVFFAALATWFNKCFQFVPGLRPSTRRRRRRAAEAGVVRYSAWPFSDRKFSRNENGFVGSGGRDLNFFPRAMPVSEVCCSSSYGVYGKAVLSFFLRATPG